MSVSVLIPTYNAANDLLTTLLCLRNQTVRNFDVLVIDGASTDKTAEIVAQFKDVITTYLSEKDNGVYDAMNKGLLLLRTPYYVVLGAGDYFYPHAIQIFDEAVCNTGADIVVAPVVTDGKELSPMRGKLWRRGASGLMAHHAVGTLIKRTLHDEFGCYSQDFKYLSDSFFILQVYRAKKVFHEIIESVGVYAGGGMSAQHRFRTSFEMYAIEHRLGGYSIVQVVLLAFRFLKFSIKRS